jgi:hypothetical protein
VNVIHNSDAPITFKLLRCENPDHVLVHMEKQFGLLKLVIEVGYCFQDSRQGVGVFIPGKRFVLQSIRED